MKLTKVETAIVTASVIIGMAAALTYALVAATEDYIYEQTRRRL